MNKVILIGNLGKDPEIKTVGDNKVARFSLATSNGKDTQWHNIILWGKSAEVAEVYTHKGSKVMVEGSISYREYESGGEKKHITEINCNSIELLDKKEEGTPSKVLVDECKIVAETKPVNEPAPVSDDGLPF